MVWVITALAVGLLLGGIKILDRRLPGSIYKVVLLVWAIGPLIATLYAMYRLWDQWISWTELSLFVVFYLITGMGITLGYHRLLTHRSFDTRSPVRFLALVAGTMANQGRPIDWAANHLKHHAHSDKDGDPHTPLEGFFHAHMGWFFTEPPADREKYGKHLLNDPMVRFIDRTWLLWVVLGFVIPFAIAGWSGLLWGGLVRMFFVAHATFAVNSICHTFGARPFDTKDESRNNWLVAMLTFGEGWHNNHHAFPGMAYHGMGWRQFDPTAVVIRFLVWMKLASNPRLPKPELVERRAKGKVIPGRQPVTSEMAGD